MRKMHLISDKEFTLEYQKTFSNVFVYNPTLQGVWFSPAMDHRLILYPQIYELDNAQIMAIVKTMSEIGDNAFIITLIELLGIKKPKHWLIPIEDVGAYYSIGVNKVLENVIYSSKGLWGIKFTMDMYAVIGGTQKFIEILRTNWPTTLNDQVLTFLDDFKYDYQNSNTNLVWLKQLLEHVYTKKKGQELLSNVGLI